MTFSAVGDKLRYQAPPGALDPTLVEGIRGHKAELLALVIEETQPPDDPIPPVVAAFPLMVQVPASAPRPDWRCPNCRFQVWSKCDGQDWYCCNCGADALAAESLAEVSRG